MSHTFIPTLPIALPLSHFITPSPNPSHSSLRIKIRPHLLVQSPLLSDLTTGRKLEECVEIIVPVGGRVELAIALDMERVQLEDPFDFTEEMVRHAILNVFQKNHTTLGLQPIEPIVRAECSSQAPSLTRSFQLNPLTASPIHNIISKNVVSSHSPYAYLAKLEIHFIWVDAPPQGQRRSKSITTAIGEEGEKEDDNEFMILDDGEEDDEEGEEEDEEDEFMVLEDEVQEDEEFMLFTDNEEDEVRDEMRGVERQGRGNGNPESIININPQNEESQRGQPTPKELQLHQGLDRLIRTHFIRRFPLIFDGRFIKYISSLTVPRALISSFSHFIHLARSHDSPFALEAKTVLKAISSSQEEMLKRRVNQAAELPVGKSPRKRSNKGSPESSQSKRRKPNSQNSSQSRSQSQPSQTPMSSSDTHEGTLEPEERARAYLAEIREARKEKENEGNQDRKSERRIARILGDTMGGIGRFSFEGRRKRSGRLSYGQINLNH